MKQSSVRMILFTFCLCLCGLLHAQQGTVHDQPPGKFGWLMGDWVGEGNGHPGQGTGFFSFKTELDGNILVRRNHTEYPSTAQKPAFVHDDMLVVYSDRPGELDHALYVDNEGHTIHYDISIAGDGNSIVFTSPVTAGMPRFRLSYQKLDASNLSTKFEIAPPDQPEAFRPYVQGKVHRK